ncbi:hypothetical protein P1P68_06040 [Streptomyces scabiei]|uniref:hypothetical protein n=1 Tax=Streptomyces scabiei TaxID=1930 RepID=UPI0029902873|nr:hypothetical protein [Streptomyces scabiei]MDW8804363.1 hypothetical protein [Streptomyces scabiei]
MTTSATHAWPHGTFEETHGEYDTWALNHNYLRGLDAGKFSAAPGIEALIDAVPPVLTLPFRGERLTIHDTTAGCFAVIDGFAGRQTSTYARFPSESAARSWCYAVVAQWLRNDLRRPNWATRHHVAWAGTYWAVECDSWNHRWYIVAGPEPGLTVQVLETTDLVEGWSFVTRTLGDVGVQPDQWPSEMQSVRDAQLLAARAEVSVAELPSGRGALVEASAPGAAGWWSWFTARCRGLASLVLRWIRRPGGRA